jgi:hypothetical protein
VAENAVPLYTATKYFKEISQGKGTYGVFTGSAISLAADILNGG